ncbi:MAG: hypothetical protein UV74_C0013G0281 [Candidatus Woesebacteria bacterium GW2011_GWB1_43_14]|uniref:Uncharacterized protein n=1 Tax=Candidatus Woesebacteria bacterium GW2011_GWB1_43_14 TaxID=1618578 RepID=A0A0G1DHK4_9BACT|nr:MAG: hypothetical protein UT21_C0002G0011 [Candidatus Woesebacteria bacterium GW2011_GWA1_39_11b]KKS78424.1 MAG: hypothetical protein UV51_C0001G0140 [Candidatus Woesebacteria bacterium GW2011_GWC1_42_9]KKS97159.1 MAG: hypothetical protein UV74_C0013G0281 [Candidatus Woesebacteria bacterium GW2011_GWB1_43_14]
MKKYLPVLLFILGLLVVVAAFFVVKSRKSSGIIEDESVPEIPLGERPYTSLTPTADGHYLKLEIKGIKVSGAESLDYELLYETKDEVTQGVPGSIMLSGKTSIDRELLLGSESSGKFRYDEGVTEGKLTLRFRNGGGKLLGKLSTDFHLQTDTKSLLSLDGKFSFDLDKASDEFFIVMSTFGLPGEVAGDISDGPYGIFSSGGDDFGGIVNMARMWDGSSWGELSGGKASGLGVFVNLASTN